MIMTSVCFLFLVPLVPAIWHPCSLLLGHSHLAGFPCVVIARSTPTKAKEMPKTTPLSYTNSIGSYLLFLPRMPKNGLGKSFHNPAGSKIQRKPSLCTNKKMHNIFAQLVLRNPAVIAATMAGTRNGKSLARELQSPCLLLHELMAHLGHLISDRLFNQCRKLTGVTIAVPGIKSIHISSWYCLLAK